MSVTISNPVFIRVKKNKADQARLGRNVEPTVLHNHRKLGSSFRNGLPLRAVSLEEEERYLPGIIGLSPTSEGWDKAVKNYWANFGKTVPADDEGYLMQAGLVYETQDDADKGTREQEVEERKAEQARLNGEKYFQNFSVRSKLGKPVNLSDYLLWRFALRSANVANIPEDASRSPKIIFYLFSKAAKEQQQASNLKHRKKAYQKFLDIAANSNTVSALVYLFRTDVDRYNKDNPQETLKLQKQVDKELALETLAYAYPSRFLSVVNDGMMMEKAFVERAIDAGELRRLPNSDIIMYGDNTLIGNNITEACNYLKLTENSEIFNTLSHRLRATEVLTSPVAKKVDSKVVESVEAKPFQDPSKDLEKKPETKPEEKPK